MKIICVSTEVPDEGQKYEWTRIINQGESFFTEDYSSTAIRKVKTLEAKMLYEVWTEDEKIYLFVFS